MGSLANVVVLVVEDDAPNRKLISLVLSNAGAEVTSVESAEEALAVLNQLAPTVVVCDLMLPALEGLELARKIKAEPATKSIVVVAVSVLNGPEVERAALAAGCAAFIHKPIDTDTFAATIAAQLTEG